MTPDHAREMGLSIASRNQLSRLALDRDFLKGAVTAREAGEMFAVTPGHLRELANSGGLELESDSPRRIWLQSLSRWWEASKVKSRRKNFRCYSRWTPEEIAVALSVSPVRRAAAIIGRSEISIRILRSRHAKKSAAENNGDTGLSALR